MKTLSTIILFTLFLTVFTYSAFSQDYRQWSLPEGARMRIGKGEIYGKIAFSPDSSLLAAASSVGIWIYDGYTGKELKLLTTNSGYNENLAFSPDGETVACSNSTELYIWDIESGSLKLTISAHNSEISGVVFDPSGETVATSSSYDKDRTIKFWNVTDGSLKYTILGHEQGDDVINFSPDGKLFGSLGDTGVDGEGTSIRIWDVATWDLKTAFVSEKNWDAFLPKIVFSPDGNTLAASGGRWTAHIFLWDIPSSSLKHTLIGHTGGVFDISFSPDGNTLASGSFDNTVCLWDVENGKHRSTIIAHTDYITSVAYSPDGNTLASYSQDGSIILWDTETLEQRNTITGHLTGIPKIAFSPDGNTLVSGGNDKTLRLWDITSGKIIKSFVGHIGPIASVTFSPDGLTIASTGGIVFGDRTFTYDFPIRIWNVRSGTQTNTLLSQVERIYRVTYSPNGKYLLTYPYDKEPLFWDTELGNLIWSFKEFKEKIGHISFSPDGNKFVYGDSDGVYLWDIASRKLLATYSGSVPFTSNIVFSPDGNTIAAGGVGQEIHLWNVYNAERNTIITGHEGKFKTVLFSPDGKTIVTAGDWEDGRLQIWDAETKELKHLLQMPFGPYKLAFSPDGNTFASSHQGGTILFWDYESIFNTTRHIADVNNDGVVDIQDLVVVAANFGKTGDNAADVNGDGVVDIVDLIKVAAAIDQNPAAPSVLSIKMKSDISKSDVQHWIIEAQQLNNLDVTSLKGIDFLQRLLLVLSPIQTALLPNYPNPFNPETWIPYQLSETTDVKIQIYSSEGKLIRSLSLGKQIAGQYRNKKQAAYWDGKNNLGEPVASGLYFYTISAGKYSATRRMVIRK